MRCDSCHKENDNSNVFCIYCSTDITPPDGYSLSDLSEQVQTLRREIRTIRSILAGHTTPAKQSTNISGQGIATEPKGISEAAEAKSSSLSSRINLELLLGGNWLARIGILAVVIGSGF